MDIKKQFGKNVKDARLKLKLTQEQLAEKIGISAKSLSQIELGNNFVSAENLEAICNALEIYPKKLFDFGDDITVQDYKILLNKLQSDNQLMCKISKIVEIIE